MEKVTTSAIHQNEICEMWSSGTTTLQLYVSSEAVDQIKSEVIRGLKSIPKRGAEVGGILFGSIRRSNENVSGKTSNCIVEVEQIFPVPVEYRFGPSYRLSEADEKAFTRALHACPERQAIGWYRSNTRVSNDPTPDDHALTAENFPTPNVFLLIKPDVTGAILASVEISGHSAQNFSFGRFSFLDKLLQSQHSSGEDADSLTVFDVQGRMHQIAPAAARLAPAPSGRNFSKTNYLAVTSAVICGGLAAWAFLRPHISPVATIETDKASSANSSSATDSGPSLGLVAEYQGRSLMVHWDRRSPAILQAENAVFTMQQGPQRRAIPLDPATLRQGGLMIRPNSSDLDLRLDVHTPNGDASQSLRVVGFREEDNPLNSILAPAKNALSPAASNLPGPGNGSENKSAKPEPLPQLEPLPPSVTSGSETLRRPASAQSGSALPASHSPTSAATKREMAALELPPDIQSVANDALPSSTFQHNLPLLSAPQPSPRQSSPLPNGPRANENTVAQVTAPPTAEAADASKTTFQARPIRKVQPQPPANIRNLIASNGYTDAASGQVVNIELSIDERGEVTGARVASESGPFVRLFEKNSLDAAKQWRFEPARIGSKPIASHMIIGFRFEQSAKR